MCARWHARAAYEANPCVPDPDECSIAQLGLLEAEKKVLAAIMTQGVNLMDQIDDKIHYDMTSGKILAAVWDIYTHDSIDAIARSVSSGRGRTRKRPGSPAWPVLHPGQSFDDRHRYRPWPKMCRHEQSAPAAHGSRWA